MAPVTRIALLDVRDELATVNSLIVAVWLAAQAPAFGVAERGALCAVTLAARDRLEAAIEALDALLATATTDHDAAPPHQ